MFFYSDAKNVKQTPPVEIKREDDLIIATQWHSSYEMRNAEEKIMKILNYFYVLTEAVIFIWQRKRPRNC